MKKALSAAAKVVSYEQWKMGTCLPTLVSKQRLGILADIKGALPPVSDRIPSGTRKFFALVVKGLVPWPMKDSSVILVKRQTKLPAGGLVIANLQGDWGLYYLRPHSCTAFDLTSPSGQRYICHQDAVLILGVVEATYGAEVFEKAIEEK